MFLIDRHILIRFAANFVLLLALLFVFAVAVDLILNLDRFVDAARRDAGRDAGMPAFAGSFLRLIVDFEGPRLFQFYAFLHGLVATGAMGFTLAQMHRHRELVAVMASGVSLRRVAMPFFLAVFGLSVIQLLNQELVLPRVAPLLLRGHGEIGERGLDSFPVLFTPDGRGTLLQASAFNPQTLELTAPTFLERDERGRTTRRLSAERAAWSDSEQAWLLTNGHAIARGRGGDESSEIGLARQAIERYPTDLGPRMLLVRHHNQFAAMLSLRQIDEMLDSPRFTDRDALLRHYYSRFSSALVNLLVLALTLPFFLLREPANLLRQSVMAAALAIPATIGSAIGMMVDLPGVSPAVAVFLPVIILMFLALFPWTYFKT